MNRFSTGPIDSSSVYSDSTYENSGYVVLSHTYASLMLIDEKGFTDDLEVTKYHLCRIGCFDFMFVDPFVYRDDICSIDDYASKFAIPTSKRDSDISSQQISDSEETRCNDSQKDVPILRNDLFEVYSGNFVNGGFTGVGDEFFEDDTMKYRGSFRNSKYCGLGRLYNNSAVYLNNNLSPILYFGTFLNGKFHGTGSYYYNTYRYKGEFIEGEAAPVISILVRKKLRHRLNLHRRQFFSMNSVLRNRDEKGFNDTVDDGSAWLIEEGDDNYFVRYRGSVIKMREDERMFDANLLQQLDQSMILDAISDSRQSLLSTSVPSTPVGGAMQTPRSVPSTGIILSDFGGDDMSERQTENVDFAASREYEEHWVGEDGKEYFIGDDGIEYWKGEDGYDHFIGDDGIEYWIGEDGYDHFIGDNNIEYWINENGETLFHNSEDINCYIEANGEDEIQNHFIREEMIPEPNSKMLTIHEEEEEEDDELWETLRNNNTMMMHSMREAIDSGDEIELPIESEDELAIDETHSDQFTHLTGDSSVFTSELSLSKNLDQSSDGVDEVDGVHTICCVSPHCVNDQVDEIDEQSIDQVDEADNHPTEQVEKQSTDLVDEIDKPSTDLVDDTDKLSTDQVDDTSTNHPSQHLSGTFHHPFKSTITPMKITIPSDSQEISTNFINPSQNPTVFNQSLMPSTNHIIPTSSRACYDYFYVPHGQGEEFYASGKRRYKGNFMYGVYEGEGSLLFNNGDTFTGHFHQGVIDGSGQFFDKRHSLLFKGHFDKGVKNGYFEVCNGHGYPVYYGEYENDLMHGQGRLFDSLCNGIVYEGEFNCGQLKPNDVRICYFSKLLYYGEIARNWDIKRLKVPNDVSNAFKLLWGSDNTSTLTQSGHETINVYSSLFSYMTYIPHGQGTLNYVDLASISQSLLGIQETYNLTSVPFSGYSEEFIKLLTSVDSSASRKLYNGLFINGKFDGMGTLFWNNPANSGKYTGFFHNNIFQGEGVFIDINGCSFSGDYQKGVLVGPVTIHNRDGLVVYRGTIDEDRRFHGTGEYFMNDGSFLKGVWEHGVLQQGEPMCYSKPSHPDTIVKWKNGILWSSPAVNLNVLPFHYRGSGQYRYPNGDYVHVSFKKKGNLKTRNLSIFSYQNEERYKGCLNDYLRAEGQGVLYAVDTPEEVPCYWVVRSFTIFPYERLHNSPGNRHFSLLQDKSNSRIEYSGSFKDGLLHGKGTLFFDQNISIQGEWENGDLCQGTVYKNKRILYMGGFKQGKRHGKGYIFEDDHLIYVGELEDDMIHGRGKLYNKKTGRLMYYGRFCKGLYGGYGTLYDENERRWIHGYWQDGQPRGIMIEYDERESVVYEGEMKDTVRDGVGWVRYGGLWYEGEFHDGQINLNRVNVYEVRNGEKVWISSGRCRYTVSRNSRELMMTEERGPKGSYEPFVFTRRDESVDEIEELDGDMEDLQEKEIEKRGGIDEVTGFGNEQQSRIDRVLIQVNELDSSSDEESDSTSEVMDNEFDSSGHTNADQRQMKIIMTNEEEKIGNEGGDQIDMEFSDESSEVYVDSADATDVESEEREVEEEEKRKDPTTIENESVGDSVSVSSYKLDYESSDDSTAEKGVYLSAQESDVDKALSEFASKDASESSIDGIVDSTTEEIVNETVNEDSVDEVSLNDPIDSTIKDSIDKSTVIESSNESTIIESAKEATTTESIPELTIKECMTTEHVHQSTLSESVDEYDVDEVSLNDPIDGITKDSIDESLTKPIDSTVHESIDESVTTEHVDESIIKESVDEVSIKECVPTEPVDKLTLTKPMNEPTINESVDEVTPNEPIDDTIKDSINELTTKESADEYAVDEVSLQESVNEYDIHEVSLNESVNECDIDKASLHNPVDNTFHESVTIEPVDESIIKESVGVSIKGCVPTEPVDEVPSNEPIGEVTITEPVDSIPRKESDECDVDEMWLSESINYTVESVTIREFVNEPTISEIADRTDTCKVHEVENRDMNPIGDEIGKKAITESTYESVIDSMVYESGINEGTVADSVSDSAVNEAFDEIIHESANGSDVDEVLDEIVNGEAKSTISEPTPNSEVSDSVNDKSISELVTDGAMKEAIHNDTSKAIFEETVSESIGDSEVDEV